jgi:ABC-type transporter Mla MlaB component
MSFLPFASLMGHNARMGLLSILGLAKPTPDTLPPFVREIEDIQGIRVLRLQGPVGKEIGPQVKAMEEQSARDQDAFSMSLLIDFRGTKECDFATVAYLVQALRQRMAMGMQVGVINAPRQLVAELEIAKLDGLIRVFGSEEQALRELAEGNPRGAG